MQPVILRLRDVKNRTGLSRSSIYSLIHQGKFPRPVKLSMRSVGWVEQEISEFIQHAIAEREAA